MKFTQFGNPSVKYAPLLAPVPTQRRLKLPRVLKWYTKEQLNVLLDQKQYKLSSRYWLAPLLQEEKKQQKARKKFQWTELEDNFLRNNYQYLSDNTIALALNLPYSRVHSRRMQLGLKKQSNPSKDTLVIVWDNRKQYDKDLTKEGFMMLRGSDG